MRPTYIYGLTDPRTREVRYVGKTVDLQKRYLLHLSRARRGTTPHVYAWIRKLQKLGLKPGLQVMAVCGEREWAYLERAFIAGDSTLLNMTSGGEGIDPDLVAAARAGTYTATYPDGTEEDVTNLSKFCREHGIPNSNAFKVVAGQRRHAHGFRFREVGTPPASDSRFIARFPDGREERYSSHKTWAEAHGFNTQSIRAVACGQKPHYKGIRIERLDT